VNNVVGAKAYFKSLNAARLHARSSPAHIEEWYVIDSATKERAVAFAVGDGLHAYALPDRRNGLVPPTHARKLALTTGHAGPTRTGWFMTAWLRGGSWRDMAIIFVEEELYPTAVVPLPTGFRPFVESAGAANVVFDGRYRDAWVITGDTVKKIQWSETIPDGHIAVTPDSRWLFLTDGERVAHAVRSIPVSPPPATGLKLGTRTFIVRPELKSGIIAAVAVGVMLVLVLAGVRLRKRARVDHSGTNASAASFR